MSELILEGKELEGKNVTVDYDGETFQYDIHERETNEDKEVTES